MMADVIRKCRFLNKDQADYALAKIREVALRS